MKKLKIRPLSPLRIIWLSIWLISGSWCLSYVVLAFTTIDLRLNIYYIVILVFAIILTPMLFAMFIFDLIKTGVEFDIKSIKVGADPADKKGLVLRRFQHKTEIFYDEIENIKFIASKKDSLGNVVENVFVQMPYMVFVCKDGQEKAINVYYYTKKQAIRIIEEAKKRTLAVGNNVEIESGEVLLKTFLKQFNREYLQKFKRKRK